MLELVRRVIGSSTVLAGCLVAERLFTLVGVATCMSSSDIGSTVESVGAEVGFALISASSSRISH